MFSKIKAIKDMRSKAKTMQHEMEEIVCVGSADGGAIKVTMDGTHKVKSVTVKDGLLQDKNRLEEKIKSATNDAVEQVQKKMAKRMQDMGGLNALKEFGL